MNMRKKNLPSTNKQNGESEMNTYQVIDEKNWERAMHCMVFRESVEPAFCVTFEADITNFRRKVKAQNLSFMLGNDVFQCSPMPWVTYTHISHTNSGKKDNATPLFDWGKYYEKDSRIVMPVSVQAHHSFVDGIHIGQFADRLQTYMDEYE